MKDKKYKIVYGGGQDHQMRMVYTVYQKSKFLFWKYWKICKTYTNRLTYAEFETKEEAENFIKMNLN